ncbi:hypothetical protein BH11MYX2_BH11MYX2_22720 [soil metagenome]
MPPLHETSYPGIAMLDLLYFGLLIALLAVSLWMIRAFDKL